MTVPEGQDRVPVAVCSMRGLRPGRMPLSSLTAEARCHRDVSEITWPPIAQCRMCRRRQRQHGNIEQKRYAQRAQQGSHRARQQSGGLRVARTANQAQHTAERSNKRALTRRCHQIIKSSSHNKSDGVVRVRPRFLQAVSPRQARWLRMAYC